jgi:hypothetical protein
MLELGAAMAAALLLGAAFVCADALMAKVLKNRQAICRGLAHLPA